MLVYPVGFLGRSRRPIIDQWTQVANMPAARMGSAAARLNDGRIMVVGGYGTFASYNNVYLYDPSANTWGTGTSYPTKIDSVRAVTLADGRILVASGHYLQTMTEYFPTACYAYNPANTLWEAVASLPASRDTYAAARLSNGKVLLAGGYDTSGNKCAEAWLYDPGANSWTATTALPVGLAFSGAVTIADGTVLAMGGNDGTTRGLAYAFNPSNATWTQKATSPTAASSVGLALLGNGKALVAGGYDGSNDYANAYQYSPAGNSYAAAAAFPIASDSMTAATLADGRAILCGGNNGSGGNVATAYIYG
jgi:N-acetylneuraminic acid mutarotase